MVFACKACKKVFRKDLREYEDADEYCPHCDNHYVLPAAAPASAESAIAGASTVMVEMDAEDLDARAKSKDAGKAALARAAYY